MIKKTLLFVYDFPHAKSVRFLQKLKEMIFDPSESNEPIFERFRGPLTSEVLFLIEL